MKNELSSNISAWFDVSSKFIDLKISFSFNQSFVRLFILDNLDDERSWIRKYLELDRMKHTLTFYSNDVCNQVFFFFD